MTFLIAQFAVLFIFALLCGFLLGRWWVRRSFIDVTDSYQTISRAATNAPWAQTWSRFDEIDKTIHGYGEQLDGFAGGLTEGLTEKVSSTLREGFAAAPQPKPDLGPALTKLGVLEKAVGKIRRETDLGPVRKSIADLDARIAALPVPPDLEPLLERMSRLETIIDEMPRFEPAEPVNLEPLGERLELVQQSVRAIRFPAPEKQLDLVPKLEPINARLKVIEAELKQLGKQSGSNVHQLESSQAD